MHNVNVFHFGRRAFNICFFADRFQIPFSLFQFFVLFKAHIHDCFAFCGNRVEYRAAVDGADVHSGSRFQIGKIVDIHNLVGHFCNGAAAFGKIIACVGLYPVHRNAAAGAAFAEYADFIGDKTRFHIKGTQSAFRRFLHYLRRPGAQMVDFLITGENHPHRPFQSGLRGSTDCIQGNHNAALHIQGTGTVDFIFLYAERILRRQFPGKSRIVMAGKNYRGRASLSVKVRNDHRGIAMPRLPGPDREAFLSQQISDPGRGCGHDFRFAAA